MTDGVAAHTLIAQWESGLGESCVWEERSGRPICATHRLFGQRMGLGKLYRVVTTEGTRLVRAPDPGTAKAAVDGSSVQRAAPHEGDEAAVVDVRPLVHIERKVTMPAKRDARAWASPEPRQFDDASGDARPTPREWELDGSPTIDLVIGRVRAGDDSARPSEGSAGAKTRPACRAVTVGKNALCIGPDGKVVAGQQEGDEPQAHGPCRWDELGSNRLVCLAHNRIIAAPARLSAWERSVARVQQLVTATFGRPRAR